MHNERDPANPTTYSWTYTRTVDFIDLPNVGIQGSGVVRPRVRFFPPETKVVPQIGSGIGRITSPRPLKRPQDAIGSVLNPRNNETFYSVDRYGAPLIWTDPYRSYGVRRDSISQVTAATTPRGNLLLFRYDSLGNVIRAQDCFTGRVDTLSYATSLVGAATVTVGLSRDSSTAGAPTVTYHYGADVLLDTIRVAGTPVQYLKLRSDGRPDSVRDPMGHRTEYKYAAAGRQNLDTVRVGPRVWSFQNDTVGRRVQQTDPNAKVTKTAYDKRNRVDSIIMPDTGVVDFTYDALFLTQVRDQIGNVHQFARNALGWDTIRMDPGNRKDTLAYDANGNLARWVNRRGQVTTFAYDALDRPTSRTAAGVTTTYTYTVNDSVRTASNAASTDSIHTDRALRTIREATLRGSKKYSIRSTFDGAGRRTDLRFDTTDVFIANTVWAFNADGLLSSLTDMGGGVSTFAYNGDRLPDTTTFPTTVSTKQALDYTSIHGQSFLGYSSSTVNAVAALNIYQDSLGRVREAWKANLDTFRVFTYDPSGRLKRAVFNRTTMSGSCSPNGDFGFDCVTGDTISIRAFDYSYDKAGNSYKDSIYAGNRVRFVETDFLSGGMPQVDTITYDADGNVIRRNTAGVEQRFYWNPLSQLDSMQTDNFGVLSSRAHYRYDGWGRRIFVSDVPDSVSHVWDGDVIVTERDTLGTLTYFTYLPGELSPFALAKSGTPYWYLYDEASNVQGLLKQDGTIANSYRYWPFGFATTSETVRNKFQFHGQYACCDAVIYMRNRYYDFRTRRFISEDPIGLAGGVNPYVYAGNDPINSSDPLGLQSRRGKCVRGHWIDPEPSEFLSSGLWVCDEWDLSDRANPFSDRFGQRGSGIPGMNTGSPAYGTREWEQWAGGSTHPAAFDPAVIVTAGAVAAAASGLQSALSQLAPRGPLFRPGGLLNTNRYLRIGIGRFEGNEVFRLSGEWVPRSIWPSGHINIRVLGPWSPR